jgi:hypothetical protein
MVEDLEKIGGFGQGKGLEGAEGFEEEVLRIQRFGRWIEGVSKFEEKFVEPGNSENSLSKDSLVEPPKSRLLSTQWLNFNHRKALLTVCNASKKL